MHPRTRLFVATTSGSFYTTVDGVNWVSARPDLDTILSKTSPSTFESLEVIPGPYGLRNGPGFGFINVTTFSTPRFEDGYESHNTFGLTYRGNGGEAFGNDRFVGGAEDYGYAITYAKRGKLGLRGGQWLADSLQLFESEYRRATGI